MRTVPTHVWDAIRRDDKVALSAMSRKGAATRKRNAAAKAAREADEREVQAFLDERDEQRREQEFVELAQQRNEHICPVD